MSARERKAPGWKDIPIGGSILEAGNAAKYDVADWRSMRPEWSRDKCINCLRCWISCPEVAINVKDGNISDFDYHFCKGCGICANVCPVEAIVMLREDQ